MAKICQVSGKKGNTGAKHIRNQHSQGWKYKAPHKNRIQHPNLQTVRVQIPGGGTLKMKVATSVIKSAEFNAIACGLKPVPKSWLKKPSYNV
jgi:ribosomal protein L28